MNTCFNCIEWDLVDSAEEEIGECRLFSFIRRIDDDGELIILAFGESCPACQCYDEVIWF